MVETMLLNSTREGVSVVFHFRAMSKRDTCRILHKTIKAGDGIALIPSRSRRNSNSLGQGDCSIFVIRPIMLSQKGRRCGLDQKICRRDPEEPHDRQQYGDVVGNNLANLSGVNYPLVSSLWNCSL